MHVKQLACVRTADSPRPKGRSRLQTAFQGRPHIMEAGGQKGGQRHVQWCRHLREQQLLQNMLHPLSPTLTFLPCKKESSKLCHLQDTSKDPRPLKEGRRLRNLYHNPQRAPPIGWGTGSTLPQNINHWCKTNVRLSWERDRGMLWKFNSQSSGW